jgi:hypothetical protein
LTTSWLLQLRITSGLTVHNDETAARDTFHDPVIAEIEIEIDVERRRARCAVSDALETMTEPIQSMGEQVSDYSIQVKIPGGFEYDEAEIAIAKVLKGSGPIAFDHQNGHSSLAHIARHPGN